MVDNFFGSDGEDMEDMRDMWGNRELWGFEGVESRRDRFLCHFFNAKCDYGGFILTDDFDAIKLSSEHGSGGTSVKALSQYEQWLY